jgi:hypothetical protein
MPVSVCVSSRPRTYIHTRIHAYTPTTEAEYIYIQKNTKNTQPKEKEHDAIFRVRVIEAKNLPAMDFGGTSDPYVVVKFEEKSRKTSTVFKTLQVCVCVCVSVCL